MPFEPLPNPKLNPIVTFNIIERLRQYTSCLFKARIVSNTQLRCEFGFDDLG